MTSVAMMTPGMFLLKFCILVFWRGLGGYWHWFIYVVVPTNVSSYLRVPGASGLKKYLLQNISWMSIANCIDHPNRNFFRVCMLDDVLGVLCLPALLLEIMVRN